jgi:uracil-DNA glycosylase
MQNHPLRLPPAWRGLFSENYPEPDFLRLVEEINRRYDRETVFPAKENVFRALDLVSPENVKIIVVGQDPYPTPGNAHGLSFSVDRTAKIPASLKTIFAELERSIEGWVKPASGDLQAWAAQGVLLLNSILTVRSREPLSHAGIGWEKFTRAVLEHAQARASFIVFILWGAKAAAIADPIIDPAKHFVIRGSHPSRMAQNRMPPERKFVGNGHFVEANRLLASRGRDPIDWRLSF